MKMHVARLRGAADRKLLDDIVALADMVSEKKFIDQYLESVRRITAGATVDGRLSDVDRKRLRDIRSKIKKYLLNNDLFTEYTESNIEAKLTRTPNDRGGWCLARMRRVGVVAALIVMGTLVVYALIIYLVRILGFSILNYSLGMFLVLMLGFYFAIAWLYYSVLGFFKPGFRVAQTLLVVGFILTAISGCQYVTVDVFDLTIGSLWQYNVSGVGLVTAALLFFAGVRRYALLLKIETFLASKWMYLLFVLGVTASYMFFVLVASEGGWQYLLNLSSMLICSLFCSVAGAVAWLIASRTTENFSRSMRWIGCSFIANALGSVVGMWWLVSQPIGAAYPIILAVSFILSVIFLFVGVFVFFCRLH